MSSFKPTAKQIAPWYVGFPSNLFQADSELQAHLESNPERFSLTVTDVQVYGMLSILEPHNAVPLMDQGIILAAEARSYLKNRKLERLIVDRSDHTEEALRRRIPAEAYLGLCAELIIRNVPLPVMLDAVEVAAMKTGLPLHIDVMNGDVRFEDIKTVGASLLSNADPDVMPLFCEMTSTAPLFTAPQLKTLLKKRGEAPLYCAIDLAEEFGAEEVLAFHSITESHSMRTHLNRVARNLDDNDQQTIAKKLAVVQHYDGMVQARKDSGVDRDSEDWNKLSFAVSIEMQEAGISPQQAWEGVSQNMTVQQILAVRDHAVELSVSSGWL